ncbi:MAG: ATP-dependent metallopeptidase FtsH/Yme1/Tma family protein [Elusimicrobia bacterium]|nr:ATP-dependent metallopeptidase FtsH/Yme1/Tma family protein [Elusimicrobiota bacterium]
MENKNIKQLALWGLAFFLLIALFQNLKAPTVEVEIPYSAFKAKLRNGDVSQVKVRPDLIRGEYKAEKGQVQHFRTLPLPDLKLVDDLETYKVQNFQGEPDRSWVTGLLVNVGWILLFFALWWLFVIRQVQLGGKQALSFGRSRAKMVDDKKKKTTFADVAGCDESKEELQEIVEFLKNPDRFQKLGGKMPRGVLLFGQPGTGKTLLARAVAGEAGVPFFSASASEFVEMFVGVGASRVRDLFDQAKKAAPAVIFVDELDAVGRHRFAGIGGGHDEREQTLNQLLIELDGFEQNQGIVLVAATNRPDVIDPALLRPGRFDRQIHIPVPHLKGREAILQVHSKKVKMAKEVDLGIIARRTPGFSGADLANVINEAALLAARRSKEHVEMSDLEESIERVMAGPQKKSSLMSDKEKKIVAYHESGHTLVAKLLPNTDPVHKVSIVSRGHALGYTLQLPTEDKFLTTRSEILNRLAVLLGGRCAEELIFEEVTTGAADDLSKASAYAMKMVTEFGMSEKVGPLSLKKPDQEVFLGRDITQKGGYSERTAQLIDEEVKRIITDAQSKARELLTKHKKILDDLAARLFDREVLNGEDIDAILQAGLA